MKRSRFAALVLALLSLGFAIGKAYGQNGVQPVERLTVVDANGKRIGAVVGFDTYPVVAFRFEKRLVILRVDWNQFLGQGTLTVEQRQFAFESSNCTGTPFTVGAFGPRLAPIHLLDLHKVLAQDGPPRTIVVRSQGSTSTDACEPVNAVNVTGATPWRLLIDLNTHFQMPLALQ